MEIVPALLENNVIQFKAKLDKLISFVMRIQVDFNDGSFEGFTSLMPADIQEFVTNFTKTIEFEAHLMVQKPYDYVPELVKLGFKEIIVQYEIEDDIREILEEIRRLEVKAGLAIGPETAISEIEPFGELIDTVTIMDIEPGKQGQKFRPEELDKVAQLRDGNFPGEIQVDGAIDADTIAEVVAAKPDTLVVGSYIVGSSDPRARFEELASEMVQE